MNHLENAVLVGAKALLEHMTSELTATTSTWENVGAIVQHDLKEAALPIVQALADAGLLKDRS